jgi:hypothetical protein
LNLKLFFYSFQIVVEEDESESAVEQHEKSAGIEPGTANGSGNGSGLEPGPLARTLGLTANSQRAFESEREYKVRTKMLPIFKESIYKFQF